MQLRGLDEQDSLENRSSGYKLKECIGSGNFGKVKKAIHIDSGEVVAIKILDKQKMEQNEDTGRVKREIAILGQVKHPNIVYLYEVINY